MVKLKSFNAPIITATLAFAAFVSNCFVAQFSASSLDSLDQICAPIGVSPLISHLFTPSTAGCSTTELPRNFSLL